MAEDRQTLHAAPPEQPAASGEGEAAGSAAGEQEAPGGDSPAPSTADLDQSDIDALVNAAGGETAAGEAPAAGAAPTTTMEAEAHQAAAEGGLSGAPFELPSFPTENGGRAAGDIALLNDVNLRVKIELGRSRMFVEDILKLNDGSVVELDKLAGDPVDVYANDRLVARGEVLVLNDNFCVRISEVLSPSPTG